MQVIDYNGEGAWSAEAIRSRYAQYAAGAGVVARDLSPMEHTEGSRHWVYPVMEKVIDGIEPGDPACLVIGIEFIEEDRGFVFGRSLKANTARALRRSALSAEQKQRILRRVFEMLRQGNVPREYREYAKLARAIGFGMSEVPEVPQTNEYVVKYHRFFVRAAQQGG